MAACEYDADVAVRDFKLKRMVEELESAKGDGTSLISLLLPPGDQISRARNMLKAELGTADHIKSRLTRLAVQSAIVSTMHRLGQHRVVPDNGLAIYCGAVQQEDKKAVTRLVTHSFEPPKPLPHKLYMCDSRFHLEGIKALMVAEDTYGFIIMDGHGCLFATLTGATTNVLQMVTVDLPKKHGRGGQSALRFARNRDYARHNYVRKVAELATQHFISRDVPNVRGLILAGSADFKSELGKSDMFDKRLQPIVVAVVDVAYGGHNGLAQAIDLCADELRNVKLVAERKLINGYFDEIARETGMYSCGVVETIKALEMGAAKTLIVWEDLDIVRYEVTDTVTAETSVLLLTKEQAARDDAFRNKETGAALNVTSSVPLVEFLAEEYKRFGADIRFVTDHSVEGTQFCRGFGGLGSILRYRVDFLALEGDLLDNDTDSSDSDSDDDDAADAKNMMT